MDPLDIIARLGGDNAPSDDELTRAVTDLTRALDAATTQDVPDLEVARDLREALDKVKEEQAARETALAEARAEAAKLREGYLDSEEAEGPDATADGEEADGEEAEAQEQPVAAASGISVVERLRQHAASRANQPKEPEDTTPQVELKSIGHAAGFDMDPDADFGSLGQMFAVHGKSVSRKGQSAPLARLTKTFTEGRTLGGNVNLNNQRISEALGFSAQKPIAAAGGLCGPGDVDHSHPICSDTGRPVRDSLPSFNASRGRVTYAPAASLGDVEGAVSIWDVATDENPDGATKPCPPVECPEEDSCEVDAVTRCLTVGNFQANFSPEFWASRLQLLMAAFDREAEQKIINEIHAASTQLPDVGVDPGPAATGNTLFNFFSSVNNVIAADRQTHRNLDGNYVVVTDSYVRTAIRNDFIAKLGSSNYREAINVADAEIEGYLSSIGARVVWTEDGTIDPDTGQHRVLTPGDVPEFTTVYVYQEAAFFFLDGGTLDLGTEIRDSALNATNDRQAFAESFEKTCFRGCSSYFFEIGLASVCGCPVPALD